jgi:hypothetical protein
MNMAADAGVLKVESKFSFLNGQEHANACVNFEASIVKK